MSDHMNYCNVAADTSNEVSEDDRNDYYESVDIVNDGEPVHIEEKSGDELLIELYKERPFLYDKSNMSFKDCLMKQNAWIEISKIMTQTNCDMYTPSYCQRRCISLRDQYNKEKRRVETESKSGSAAVKPTRFPFFSQLAFLNPVIKRRRSYTNCIQSQPSMIDKDCNISEAHGVKKQRSYTNCIQSQPSMIDKDCNIFEAHGVKKQRSYTNCIQSQPSMIDKDCNIYEAPGVKRQRSYTTCTKSQPTIVDEESSTCEWDSMANESNNEDDEIKKQHSNFKENVAPKMRKRKITETKKLEQTLIQMSHKLSTYMEKKVSTANDAFMEFIKIQFYNIPEKEKNSKRRMIMDVLTAPIPEK